MCNRSGTPGTIRERRTCYFLSRPPVGSHVYVYTRFFFLRARVYLHTHIGAACFTWRDGRVLVDSHKQIHAQETSETERRMRARGARHCKRMLIIFTSCNSVTLNHRQATSLPRPLFRVIIVFLFSRARARAILIPRYRDHHRRHVRLLREKMWEIACRPNLSASSIFDVAADYIRYGCALIVICRSP